MKFNFSFNINSFESNSINIQSYLDQVKAAYEILDSVYM